MAANRYKFFQDAGSRFYPVQLLLFAFIYFCLGKLGLSLAVINSSATTLWSPTGMALVALLVWGNRLWPGIFIGAFLVEYSVAGMLGVSLCTATGNLLEALVGAWLVRRFAGGLKVFEQTRTTLKYFCLAPLVSTLISATVGVTSLWWWQQTSWPDYGPTWLTWWLGNLASDVIIAPCLLLWLTPPLTKSGRKEEGLWLSLLVVGICLMVFKFAGIFQATSDLKFLVFFPLLWAAFRFGPRVTMLIAVVIAGSAICSLVFGNQTFLNMPLYEALLLMQIFLITISITSLVVAVVVVEKAGLIRNLSASQARWQFALEGAGASVWEWDIAANKVMFSKRWKEMLGYAEDEIGDDYVEWTKRVHPDDLPEALAVFDKYARGESPDFGCEFRMLCKDGGWKWVLTRGMATKRAGSGRPLMMIGTQADITERKRMEIQLRASEERHRAVVEDQTEVISRFDADGTFRFVNEVFCRFFGRTRADLLGTKWHPAVAPEDLPLIENELGKLSPANPVVTVENRVYAGDGQLHWMQFVNRGLFDAAGRLVEIQSVGRDITEKQKAMAALRVSEERFRLMYETMLQGVVVQDAAGQIVSMNLAAEKILGRPPDELMGKTSEQEEHHTIRPDGSLFPGKEHPSMVALQTGRQVQNVVMGIFNPQQQQRRWISISAVPVFQNGESPPHQVYALFNDITEGRLLLEKIRFSEERYRSLTEATPDGVYMLDRDFICQYVNPVMCQWYGKTADELVGRSHAEFLKSETALSKLALIQQVFATGEVATIKWKVPFLVEEKWVETRFAPIRNNSGKVEFVLAISRDLSELHQATQLVRESEAWSRKVLETTVDGFFRMDQHGKLLEVNDAYCRMIGYTRPELLAMNITDISLFAPTPAHIAMQIQRIINRGSDRFESRHRCKDGRIIEFDVVCSHFKLRETYFFSFMRDITEQKQLEREISEISATERQRIGYDLHDGLGQHLAGVAFKTKALEETLAAQTPELVAEAADIVRLLNDAISQTRSLARMLAPVEVEANGLPTALENLADEIEKLFHIECVFSSEIQRLTLDEKTGMTLYRIAQEAIHNATNRGGARRVEIRLSLQAENRICLIVRDNGKGFATAPPSKSGMGLRIMKYRASSIGGGISIRSKIGVGTEVKCLLPLRD